MAERSNVESILMAIETARAELEHVKFTLEALEYHTSEQTGLEIPIDFDDSDVTDIQAWLQLAEDQIQEALSVIDEIF